MTHRLTGVLCAVLALLSLNARAVTLDFQSLEHVDALQTLHGTTYAEDGFTITAPSLFSFGTLSAEYRGSTALRNGNQGTSTQLSADNGSAFNLVSIDLAEIDAGTATVGFTGFLAGGGTVTQSFTLDDSFTTGTGFETFVFSGFSDITSVKWDNGNPYHQFDNIVASTVPLPAAVWLFGSGLLGLFGLSRRS